MASLTRRLFLAASASAALHDQHQHGDELLACRSPGRDLRSRNHAHGNHQHANPSHPHDSIYSGNETWRDKANAADCDGTPVPGCPEPTLRRCSPCITCRTPSRVTKLRSRGESTRVIVLRSPGCKLK